MGVEFLAGAGDDFQEMLEATRTEDARLRQTTAGPHRDEMLFSLEEMPAVQFASEGQQRTLALALRLAQAGLIRDQTGEQPLLLLDDVFGELDEGRRHALFATLPDDAQKFVTATHLGTLRDEAKGVLFRVDRHRIERSPREI